MNCATRWRARAKPTRLALDPGQQEDRDGMESTEASSVAPSCPPRTLRSLLRLRWRVPRRPGDSSFSSVTPLPRVSLGMTDLRRITGEDEVAISRWQVAGVTGFVQRLVARFAVREVGESPAARRDVLFRVLDHELDIHN